MAGSGNVNEYIAEVGRQTVRRTVSVQDALRRCLDGGADTGNAYLAAWDAVHEASLGAALHFQMALILAWQAVLGGGFRPGIAFARAGTSAAYREPVRWVRLAPRASRRTGGAAPTSARVDTDSDAGADEWAASALNFPPPLGMVAPHYEGSPDEEI